MTEILKRKRASVGLTASELAAAKVTPDTRADSLFTHAKLGCNATQVTLHSLIPSWYRSDTCVTVFDRESFTPEQQARIPEINPYYRPCSRALNSLAYAIEYTEAPTLLTGLPSVGKSSLVEFFCAITNRPFFRFNYNGTMDSSSLLGTQSASGGSTHWHDGVITEALKVPHSVLLHDEWTFAPPEVLAALQYVLERNGKLILADKPGTTEEKTIRPAEGCRMVFADNTRGAGDVTGKFVGTQVQNSATLDRIGTFIEVNFLAEENEIEMLSAMFPDATYRLVGSLVRTANLCRMAYSQGNLSTVLSLRVLCSWLQHALNLQDVDKALDLAFINRLDSKSEQQAVKSFLDVTMGTRKK